MTLKEAREFKGMTRLDLAFRSGVSLSSVAAYEVGVRIPSVVRAREIETILGQRPGDIEWLDARRKVVGE